MARAVEARLAELKSGVAEESIAFVPTGEGQERDNAEELRLRNELQGELPIEEDLSRWLGLFDAPLD